MKTKTTAWLLALVLAGSAVAAEEGPGIGPWRLGMTKEQVKSFAERGPYQDVGATGNLETSDGKFHGHKAKTKLVFAGDALRSIEVRVFEGTDWRRAKTVALEVYDQFASEYGGANVKDVSSKISRSDLEQILDRTLGTAEEMNKQYAARQRQLIVTYDMVPLKQPADSRLHSQWVYLGKDNTYAVVLYQDAPGVPKRDAEESITIEKL